MAWKCIKTIGGCALGITAISAGVMAAYIAVHGVPETCRHDKVECHWVIPPEEWKPGGMFYPGNNPLLKGISINYPEDVRKDCDHNGRGIPKHCNPDPSPNVNVSEPKSIFMLIIGLFGLYAFIIRKRKNV